MQRWLRTNEKQEFISSVRMVSESLLLTRGNLENWKWVIISIHNAMQAAMVISLRAGNNLRVMPDKLAEKWLSAYQEGRPLPEERMDSFGNLYSKVKNEQIMGFFVHSRALPATDELDRSMEKVLDLRNQFIHFLPQGLSLELSGMPAICLSILKAIKFLGWDSGNVIWMSELETQTALNEVLRATAIAEELKVEYEK